MDEMDAVVNGAVRVALRTKIAVGTTAIADDCSARFDPVTYDGHQCVGGFVRYGNKKCSAGLSFYTTTHPLTLNRVSSMILLSTELALVNLDGLLRTTNFSELPSINTSMVSLQNIPQSATVCALREYSCRTWLACSRKMMSYVMSRISRKVRLLCWNHDQYLMDTD
jgi:hypothetical protein